MSKIRGKDTKPEIMVRKFLFSKGFRFRLHEEKLPGKPDIVLAKYKKVIFVHGCYWHGHKNCRYFVIPKTRTDWWLEKINATIRRDQENMDKLKSLGWIPVIVWECELKPDKKKYTLDTLIKKILD